MIAYIEGKLTESNLFQIVIDIQGIGYEINIPLTTAEKLPPVGQIAKVFTLAVYREDSQTLYGFHNKEDREFFRLLVEKVSGIGPKIAINIMSRLSVLMLKNAIAQSDIALLSKCPGIGKKTAERLVIELRDKVFPGGIPKDSSGEIKIETHSELTADSSPIQDAIAALTALGYKLPEADKSIRKASAKLGDGATTEALIKAAIAT